MAKKAKDDSEEGQRSEMRLDMVPSLISKANMLKAEMEGPRGELGDHYKTHVEKVGGFNRKAFKQVVALENMEDTQRADWLRTFDAVRTKMNWDAQGDFFEDKKEAAAPAKGGKKGAAAKSPPPPPAEDPDIAEKNMRAVEKGIRPLEEPVH